MQHTSSLIDHFAFVGFLRFHVVKIIWQILSSTLKLVMVNGLGFEKIGSLFFDKGTMDA